MNEAKVKAKHRCYVKLRRTGPECQVVSIDRDVICSKCGVIDKVRTRRQARVSATKHKQHMVLLKKYKNRIKELKKTQKQQTKKAKKLRKAA